MDANILIKALTEQVKQYSEIQAERSKLKGDMFLNAIKAKQNFFFKQQEQAAKQKEKQQAQQVVQSRIGALQEGQADITPYEDPTGGGYPGGYSGGAGVGQVKEINPLGETPTPQIGVGKEGLSEVGKPLSRKEFIFKRIQDKNNMKSLLESKGDPRAKNFELSATEKEYESKYLGTEYYGEDDSYKGNGKKESLIEPRAEGLGRIGRGAKYGEAVKSYGKETTDRIIGIIQDYQKEGKSFGEITELMDDQGINAELFLKFYR